MDDRLKMAAILLALCLSACAHTASIPEGVWSNPERHDGEVMEVVIYPYDIENRAGDTAFGFCLSPGCPRSSVEGKYIETTPDRFRGWTGDRPARVTLRFDAVCFRPDAVCNPHYPFIFDEILPEATAP